MHKIIFYLSLMVMGLLLANGAQAGGSVNNPILTTNIELVFTGHPQPNSENPNGFSNFPSAIAKFCSQNACLPTTQFPLLDPVSGQIIGDAHVWGANYLFGANGSLCFTEIIQYSINIPIIPGFSINGDVYTLGDNGGTCGAFTDPTLPGLAPVAPQYGGVVVVVGGGGGHGSNPPDAQGIHHGIVGATGDFKFLLGGNYLDRVFVEFAADHQTITYYNGLYFTLSPPNVSN